MSRVLCAWELGGGTGHLYLLTALADELRRHGHEPLFVVRDLAKARRFVGPDATLLPAPFWMGSSAGRAPAASYNEVLLRVGYGDPEAITALSRAWLTLFDLLRPDVLLAEHAPTALLAARARGLPALVTGTGFTLPPDRSPLPSLEPWHRLPPQRLAEPEQRVLRCLNQVLQATGGAPLEEVAGLFPGRGYLATFAELDHYGARDGAAYWGHLMATPPAEPAVWPRGRGERIFVYMHPAYRPFAGLMEQLRRLGFPTLVVAPGIPQALVRRLEAPRLKITPRHLDLASVVAQSRVVVCHSPHGTLCDLFRLGRPALMLPYYVEQTVLAWRTARQGLGIAAMPGPKGHDYGRLIERLLSSPALYDNARAFAERHRRFDPARQLTALGEAMDAEIRALSAG